MWKFGSRTHFVKELWSLEEGSEVSLQGWVYRKSELGGLLFIRLRDSTGAVQVVFKEGVISKDKVGEARRAGIEASISVKGVVRRDPRAPGGIEVVAKDFELVGSSDNFPIRPGAGEEFLLDNRHLYIRSTYMRNVLKVREVVLSSIDRWFRENGFVRVEAPTFVGAAVEGGATLFEVPYFGRKAYLTQSSQFYLEALIFSFENVYTIQPSFRAEKSRTRRHLTEFWHAEAEMAWADLNGMMDVVESLIKFVTQEVSEKASDNLKSLNREFRPIDKDFPRLSYDEAVDIAQSKGVDIEWGDDFGTEAERVISLEFDTPVFVHRYPKSAKAFYHKPDPERKEVVLCADLLAPEGIGEIVGGGQRIERLDELLARIKEEGLNPDDYQWYLDLRRYGSVPHSGFGLGVERLVRWITGIDHIRDAIAFPRTPTRLYP